MDERRKDDHSEFSSASKITVKKSEDIKSFAESTMNELLGWYGYSSTKRAPKASRNSRSTSVNNDSESESLFEGCGWCGKPVDETNSVVSATAAFCSELCFSQSRRASFKRNKTCDWCRHSHHTVSYVELQDNSTQLQFCSDSCLNQYKMRIFCRETQAHLELHPHVHESSAAGSASSGGLITPDLWMRDCVAAPESGRTSPSNVARAAAAPPTRSSPSDAKRNRHPAKRFRRGACASTVTSSCDAPSNDDAPQDLRIRHSPPIVADAPLTNVNVGKCRLSPGVAKQPHDDRDHSRNIRDVLGSVLPPPTTFIPYPVILPLPIPIPIPIPIPKMFKTNNGKDLVELKHCSVQTDETLIINTNNNNIESDLEVNSDPVTVEEESSKQTRLLRKRKQPKVAFPKHKKTFSTLP